MRRDRRRYKPSRIVRLPWHTLGVKSQPRGYNALLDAFFWWNSSIPGLNPVYRRSQTRLEGRSDVFSSNPTSYPLAPPGLPVDTLKLAERHRDAAG